jgi:hypothetical protein
MNFSEALTRLKEGRVVLRHGWKMGELRIVDKPTPVIVIFDPGEMKKWQPTQEDILATDWGVSE